MWPVSLDGDFCLVRGAFTPVRHPIGDVDPVETRNPDEGATMSGPTEFAPLLTHAGLGWVAAAAVLAFLAPIVAATAVLTWHALRGTKPSPAARLLLQLVELVLPRRR